MLLHSLLFEQLNIPGSLPSLSREQIQLSFILPYGLFKALTKLGTVHLFKLWEHSCGRSEPQRPTQQI